MNMTTFLILIALAAWGSFPLGCWLIPETDEDITFDWIKARYTYPDTEESEMEQERRLR